MTEIADPAQTQAPQVNAADFASSLVAQLAPLLGSRNVSEAQKVDEIADVYNQLSNMGLDKDEIQAHISTAMGLDKRTQRLIDEKAAAATAKIVGDANVRELKRTIKAIIRDYSRDDDGFAFVAETIQDKVMAEFSTGTSPDIQTARSRFIQRQDLDETVLEDMVKRHYKNFETKIGRKKETSSPAASGASTTGKPEDGNGNRGGMNTDSFDEKSLDIPALAAYRAHKNRLSYAGMDPEKVEKGAREAALRIMSRYNSKK